ncbi:MFS transporter [Actinomadura sp. NPDC048394]|uniref:MFS transporter n=1 Tax=Actinomadura sp. NPDC048394 TaxID=3158223 RepID=UPI0033D24CB6
MKLSRRRLRAWLRRKSDHSLGADFTWLWLGSTVSQLGSVSAMAAFPLLALSMQESPVLAGWVTTAGTLPPLLLQIPAGVLVERLSRWRVMQATLVVRLVSALVLLVAFLLWDAPIGVLLAAAAIEGTCTVFYGTAEITSVPRVVQHELLPVAIAKNEARSQGSLLFGRPLGGLLATALSWATPLLSLCTALAAILSLQMVDKSPLGGSLGMKAGMRHALKEGLAALRRDRFLRNVLTICVVTNVLFQIIILLFVVLAREQHRSALFIGAILAVSGLGGLIGSSIAPRVFRIIRPRNVILFSVTAWLALTIVIASRANAWLMVTAWGGIGFVGANVNVALALYQASCIDTAILARVASAGTFVTRLSAAVGALCAGYIVSSYGPARSAGWVLVVMIVLTGLVLVHRIFLPPEPGTECLVSRPHPHEPETAWEPQPAGAGRHL